MAVIPAELIDEFYPGSVQGRVIHWDNIGQGDTCEPYEVIGFADKDVDINGTDNGGTIAIHEANHPTDPVYSVVKDNANDEITGKVDSHYTVVNHCYSIKPILTGGGGSTDFDITLILYNAV